MAVTYSRPNSDISLRHSVPTLVIIPLSAGYAVTQEETADGDSSYMYQTLTSSTSSVTTRMGMSAPVPSTKTKVTAVKLAVNGKLGDGAQNGSISATFTVNGAGNYQVSGTLTSSYKEFSASNANMVAALNAAIEQGTIPTIEVSVTTSGRGSSSSKTSDAQIRVTQVYLQVTYDEIIPEGTGLFVKENGEYIEVQAVYKKINGVYIEQTDIASLLDVNTKYLRKDG